MHLTRILLRTARRTPQDPNKVPFRNPSVSLKLRQSIAGRKERVKDDTGLEELALLFASLKANDFNENYCKKEIDNLQRVFLEGKKRRAEEKKLAHSIVVKPGRDLHHCQLNLYLRKFPPTE